MHTEINTHNKTVFWQSKHLYKNTVYAQMQILLKESVHTSPDYYFCHQIKVFKCIYVDLVFSLQIEYLDVHETNGYEVEVDDEATLSCVISTSGDENTKKHNTCHTSGVFYLQRGILLLYKKFSY